MKIHSTHLAGLIVLDPSRHTDSRGFFSESWNREAMTEAGLCYDFVQDNHSLSKSAGTVRGMHFQSPPRAQGKLVRCGRGRIFDVAVDIRRGSPTYGQWAGVELSFANGLQLLVPTGFLHGFMTLEPDSEIVYKCTDYYDPGRDRAIRWDSCGIEWPNFGSEPVLSEKDRDAPALADLESPFYYEE